MEANKTSAAHLSETMQAQDANLEQNSLLHRSILQDSKAWEVFLNYFLLVGSLGFFCSGVVFFFAFNWQEITIWYKLAIILLGIFIGVYVKVFTKLNPLVKDFSLLGSSILIGVLFAVFGQYFHFQPDSYLLFTLWALAILPWTFCSSFSLQWLLLVALYNTSLLLFTDQESWAIASLDNLKGVVLCIGNSLFYGFYYLQTKVVKTTMSPFVDNLLCVIITMYAVGTLISLIMDGFIQRIVDAIELCIALAWLCFIYISSLKNKSSIKYSLFLIGCLITVFTIVVEVVDLEDLNYLIYGVYWLIAAVFSLKNISNRIKKWHNG